MAPHNAGQAACSSLSGSASADSSAPLLNALWNNPANLLILLDREGRIERFNRAAEQITGYTSAEVCGRVMWDFLVCSSDVPHARGVFSALCGEGGDESGESRVMTKSGRELRLAWWATSLAGETTATGHVLLSAVDLRPQAENSTSDIAKRVAAELAASERRFRELADMLPDMVYECDPHGVVTYANQMALDKLGYGPEDLAGGYKLLDLLAEEEKLIACEALARIAEGETETRQYSLQCADGRYLPVEIRSAAVRGANGELTGFRGVARDTSDRQEMEETQRMAALGQLAAGVAHEFNNILAAMFGWAELARAQDERGTQQRLVETVLSGAGRGAEICKKLIGYARPVAPERSPLRVEVPLQAALAIAERELEKAEIEVRRDFNTAGKCLLGDSPQLQQVFLNLIINARHAMRGGGVLTVRSTVVTGSEGREEIVVTVTDSGYGIAAQDIPHIFEPFFTTKSLDRSEFGGSGLGLSVSHSIVKAHEGAICVFSREGYGTTFSLRFAAHDAVVGLAGEGPETHRVLAPNGAGRRVLVAEDEKNILEALRRALTHRGHNVHAVLTTDAALIALRDDEYDLVITDLLMPGGGGNELLNVSRQMDNPPPIILITGMIEDKRLEQMMEQGVKACLKKPFSLSELVQTVDDLLTA